MDERSSAVCVGEDGVITKQLPMWKKENPEVAHTHARDAEGHTLPSLKATLRIGEHGPILMSDLQFIKHMQSLVQEPIPARVTNDNGCGAHGVFRCTDDLSKLTLAKLFTTPGKETKVLCRFSASKDKGTSDVNRITPKGLSVKFYTEDGNLDMIGIHLPIFYFNDGLLYPSLLASPYNPQSNLLDPTARWDFLSSVPESTYASLYFMSDRGLPRSFRHMNFHTIHTFKLVDESGSYRYGRWTFCPTLKEENCLSDDEVKQALRKCPELYCRDMYIALANDKKPSWTLYLQTMTEEDTKKFKKQLGWDAFDVTKEWPEDLYPRQRVGTLTLTSNLENYFVESELALFSPGNLVPGIQPAYQDRLLACRIFSYIDAHNHRLGSNASMLPVNQPQGLKEEFRTYLRDGPMFADQIQQGAPNYYPNSFGGPEIDPITKLTAPQKISGTVGYYDFNAENKTDWYGQAEIFWTNTAIDERKRIVKRFAEALKGADMRIKTRVANLYKNVSGELGEMLREAFELQ